MKPETKLWIRRRVLMALRWLVWTADEFLHAAEIRLRHDLACHAVTVKQSRPGERNNHQGGAMICTGDQVHTSGSVAGRRSSPPAVPELPARAEAPGRAAAGGESYQTKRLRRHFTAADFDRELTQKNRGGV